MPPKSKQVKKGPVYKTGALLKDILPTDIKEPPRQPKPIKSPQSIPQVAKNQIKPKQLFEQWPSQEAVKATDFGITSDKRFQDSSHQELSKRFTCSNIISWKSFLQIEKLKNECQEQPELSRKSSHQGARSVNEIRMFQGIGQDEQKTQAKQPLVIETYMRDQTPEEAEIRMKEQTEKAQKAAKDKKKAKKEEPKQQGPIKVSDVKMSDIKISDYMPDQSIWIGSQLQIIKIRNLVDTYSKQPVWKKIYPQEKGVPQLTKSGKYWVKLYYMGTPIKVEIDDRVPINYSSQEMLPVSEKSHEKWTLILSKALIKYMNIVNPNSQKPQSGLILYALTGMISEEVSLKNYKDWTQLQGLMTDSHYTKKDVLVACYTTFNSKLPSNYIKSVSQAKDFLTFQNSTFKKNKSPRKVSAHNFEINPKVFQQADQPVQKIEEYIEPEIVKGYAYCIGDYFENGQFNMAFSRERSHKQMKLRQEYNNMSMISLNTKTREEKLQHRRKKKQLKQQLQVEQKKRLQLINKDQSNYHFLKLLANLKIHCQFSQRQIKLAKKCRLNNLNQPPNYEVPAPADKDQNKSSKSVPLAKTVKQESQVNPNIQDFTGLENAREHLQREDQGVWIKDIDFISSFTNLQIIYNPETFREKCIERVHSENESSFTLDASKEILVVQKIVSQNQQQNENQNEQEQEQRANNKQQIELLFGIHYQKSQENKEDAPYCILQKFDFDQFSVTSSITKLDKEIDSKYLRLKNQNNVFKIYTMCKGSYCLWVSSNSKFKLMSISDYLQEYQGYKKKSFTVEHPALQGANYFPLSKYKIKQQSEQQNSLVIKITSLNATEVLKSLSYCLVQIPKEGEKYFSEQDEGVVLRKNQKKYLADEYTKINISPNQQYALAVEAFPNESVADGSLQINFFTKNQTLLLQTADSIEPVKFVEKYKPNKYGLIFRERLFSAPTNTQSFYVKIVQGEQVQAGGAADKKPAKKGVKEQAGPQFIEKVLQQSRTVILRIKKNQQIIYQARGANWVIIPSLQMPISNEPSQECFIQASFDLRQWPQARNQSQETAKICWVIQSFGTQSLALVRDTKQEEQEKQTRKSWEDKEPGRAERAKKSRKRFLIQMKKEKGENLTEQEELIISNPRLTKKQQLEQEKKNQEKTKKGGKKQDKKAGKQVKKEQIQEKPVVIEFPKSQDNCSSEIKKFLKTLEDFKVRRQQVAQNSQATIRSDEEIKSLKQSQSMSAQNRISMILRNVDRRETVKLKERDRKDQLALHLEELNSTYKEFWGKYIVWRNQDFEKDKTKQEKQRAIGDLFKQQKPAISEADLEKTIKQYQQLPDFNAQLCDVLVMLKKNIRIGNLNQKISAHLAGWEVQDLKAINEQIATQKIEGLRADLMAQVKSMLEEVEKNPGIVQEKLNEAKKTKKGGKK